MPPVRGQDRVHLIRRPKNGSRTNLLEPCCARSLTVGGHTALFGCVVSQPQIAGRRNNDRFARLLLDHGADPTIRASLRKRLRFVEDETLHVYRNVTALQWGRQFHGREWVNESVLDLLAE